MENKKEELLNSLHDAFNKMWDVYTTATTTKENDKKMMDSMMVINKTISYLEELEK